jgi:AraC-like DNA-binding protein
MIEDYNRIIDSLSIRYIRIASLDVLQSVKILNYYDVQNSLVLVTSGTLFYGKQNRPVNTNQLLFIPGGKNTSLTFGEGTPISVTYEEYLNKREKFLRTSVVKTSTDNHDLQPMTSFLILTFEAKVFDSVNFFTTLDFPPFEIEAHEQIAQVMKTMAVEYVANQPGKHRLLMLYNEQIVIDLIRYVLNTHIFVEKIATNNNYFKDPRLIHIFNYIKDNLAEDLSNKALASVASVSEDYVGQYFKSMTGINPQDYIEYQRMEKAVNLLRTSKKSIRVIGQEVGYKDTAYFCRRFKMMFGISAGKMRKRESTIAV